MAIRVLIADDHEMVRVGLRNILESFGDIQVVAETFAGRLVLETWQASQPDVSILDVRMPDGDGLAALADVKRHAPDARVLMFSVHDNPIYVVRAMMLGACGYILKTAKPSELVHAVRSAFTGEASWNGTRLRAVTLKFADARLVGNTAVALTKQERRVLQCIAQGMTNNQIAEQLSVSYDIAKGHLSSLLRKIGVWDRTQVAVWAVREGVI